MEQQRHKNKGVMERKKTNKKTQSARIASKHKPSLSLEQSSGSPLPPIHKGGPLCVRQSAFGTAGSWHMVYQQSRLWWPGKRFGAIYCQLRQTAEPSVLGLPRGWWSWVKSNHGFGGAITEAPEDSKETGYVSQLGVAKKPRSAVVEFKNLFLHLVLQL